MRFRTISFTILAFLAVTLSVSGESYFIARSVVSTSPEIETVRMLVHFVETSDKELTFRIGFQNTSRETVRSFGFLNRDDFALVDNGSKRKANATDVSPSLSIIVPPDGLPPGGTTVGNVTFNDLNSTGMTLAVRHFKPIIIPIVESARIGLPLREAIPIEVTLESADSTSIPIELHLESLTFADNGTGTFSVKLQNTSGEENIDAKNWNFNTNQIRLIDAEAQVHTPSAISDELQKDTDHWQSAETRSGTFAFPFTNPFAATQLTLTVPGYGSLLLAYAPNERVYSKIAFRSTQTKAADNARRLSQAASGIISRILGLANRALKDSDDDAFLRHFDKKLHPGQKGLLANRQDFVSAMVLEFPALQSFPIGKDQSMTNVRLLLRHRIQGIPDDNPLVARVDADFIKVPGEERWIISRFDIVKRTPFWHLGYTIRKQTDHFMIFHQKDAAPDRVEAIASDLEQAFLELQTIAMPQEEMNLIVLAADSDHVATISDQTAEAYDAAQDFNYDLRGEHFAANNRLVLVNATNIESRKELWNCNRVTILKHDLIHLGLASQSHPLTPVWLSEGMAVHFSGQLNASISDPIVASEAYAKTTLAALSRNNKLTPTPGAGPADWVYAGLAVRHLVMKVGSEKLLQFHGAFSDLGPKKLKALSEKHTSADSAPPPLHEILLMEMFDLEAKSIDTKVRKYR